MDEIELVKKRHQQRLQKINKDSNKDDKKISKIFSKILLSVIFILISCIYIHLDENNLKKYQKYIFEDNLTFAKINSEYQKFLGSLFPSVTSNNDAILASNNVSLNEYYNIDNYTLYKIKVNDNSPINVITSGIVVYLDEKEGYGKTIIIQGIDGYDIWYGNVTDPSVKLYDYVEKGTILANSNSNYYYNVFYKDGNKVTYEEYYSQIQN